MKTKAIIVLCVATFASVNLFGQRIDPGKITHPIWVISKDVQRLQFRNSVYEGGALIAGDGSIAVSKGVNRINAKKRSNTPIIRSGMPSHVISKGVARWQYEKENK